jgi:hypothetical protein
MNDEAHPARHLLAGLALLRPSILGLLFAPGAVAHAARDRGSAGNGRSAKGVSQPPCLTHASNLAFDRQGAIHA